VYAINQVRNSTLSFRSFREAFPVEKKFDETRNTAMQEVLKAAHKVALSDLSVMIVGEHGTGKEWLARMMHQFNQDRTGPFWPFDCAAIPEKDLEKELFGFEEIHQNGIIIHRGAFEEAEHGTLLLNEVDALPAALQMKVSRTIEFRTFHRIGSDQTIHMDVRIIATLSQPADSLITGGMLSKDMFYRISPIILELPPLRQRKEDIPLLLDKFLTDVREHNRNNILGVGQEATLLCLEYDWPGNVRQLKNALEHAFIMCTNQWIQPEHFPHYIQTMHSSPTAHFMSNAKK
jgi:transcriptional regulator with PAS, ATPase and Fis domain